MVLRVRALLLAAPFLITACSISGGAGENCGGQASCVARAQNFTLQGVDGKQHSLTDYKGKVVLINFWATWCIPCRAEMPDLEHEFRVHQNDGLVVLGIETKEDPSAGPQFLADLQIDYPILYDKDGNLYAHYNIAALPQSFIVNRTGLIVQQTTGILTRQRLEPILQPLLKQT